MATYEESQKALRAQVPKGTAGAAELARQGFTGVGINQQDQALQKLADTNPEQADLVMDKLGYTGSPNLTKVPTQSVGPGGEKIYDVFAGQEHIANPNDPRLKGIDIAGLPEGQAPEGFKSKFETGFQQANQALGDGAKDVSGTQGADLVNQYSPARTNDFSSMFVKQDPFLGSLVAAFQEFVSPAQQRTSLREEYSKMVQASGIEQIDLDLINLKNVVDGTEDDIRLEIEKSGGYASNSQILSLAASRNKTLLRQYNTLLDTRNAKEKYLQTSLQLEQADRQMADQRFESAFNMSLQIADYQQKMQRNSIESLDRVVNTIGWSGLLESVDEFEVSMIERLYGLPSGGLLQAAQRERQISAQAEQERQLELEGKKLGLEETKLGMQLRSEQIKTEQAQRAKIVADTQKIIAGQKGTILDPTTPEGAKQLALNKSKVDQIGNILSSGNLKTAVGPNIFSRFGTIRRIFRPGDFNFIGDVEQLRSQLSLQSLIDAKSQGATFGALSDQEMQILSTAGTKIGSWVVKDKGGNVTGYRVKESDFKAEMDKVNNFAKLDYIYRGGNPEDVGVLVIDGKYYTKNSDESVTEL